jgi:flagellar biosynthesis GTPase FlhF
MRTKLPISYICTGQRIPDDLQDAQKEVLAGWVLGEVAL